MNKWINRGNPMFGPNQIKTIEKKYNATWIGAFAAKNTNGGWTEHPVDVFFQPNPPEPPLGDSI